MHASEDTDPECPFKAHYAVGGRGVLRSLALRKFKQWRGILPSKRGSQPDHTRRNRGKVGVSGLISGLSRPTRQVNESKPVWTRFAYFTSVIESSDALAVKLETASDLDTHGLFLHESKISVKKEEGEEDVDSIQNARAAVASNPVLQQYAALAESIGEIEGEENVSDEIEGEDKYLDDTWTDGALEDARHEYSEADDDDDGILDAIRLYEDMYK
ncbi:hypothetical protein BJ741DRAFT_625111 [Chytriomyces cf. hyalinus JEL632]|nr:hypothetical protein BJ741DRAFT_625111 [Chytriomyces cf. hyalinus JEL632]